MLDARISCHARRRELSQAVQVFNSIADHGLLPSTSSYHSLLHAYSKSGHPPYGIQESIALEAESVFKTMVQAGHRPSLFAFQWLMETQARAGLASKAVETFDLLVQHGKVPDAYSLTNLVDAYARAKQPLKAQEIFDAKIAEHDIQLTIANWNALLGAYAKAGHMDGAYATWQKMLKHKVVPNAVTQRVLAMAFGGNPQMASALVAEAQKLQDAAAAEPDGTPTERPDFPGNKARQHSWQMQAVGAGIGPRGPFVLDLHGLSKPAAGLALQNRLQFFARNPELLSGPGPLPKRDLIIITGIGRNSFTSTPADSMRTAVQQQLVLLKLPCKVGTNEGRVYVSHEALFQYVRQEQRSSTLRTFLHEASLRYLMVFGGVSGIFAATYVIPKLLEGQ
ncbi:hypothetical protein ABBQ32_013426 [Trebouxia sp. C0010 RCD-2024]